MKYNNFSYCHVREKILSFVTLMDEHNSSSESDAPLTKTRGPGRPKKEREPQEKVNRRKIRSDKQVETFNKARAKRLENIKETKREKEIRLARALIEENEKKKDDKAESDNDEHESDNEESEEEKVIVRKKHREPVGKRSDPVGRKKPVKTRVVYITDSDDETSESEEEQKVIVRRRRNVQVSRAKPNRKEVVSESEEETDDDDAPVYDPKSFFM